MDVGRILRVSHLMLLFFILTNGYAPFFIFITVSSRRSVLILISVFFICNMLS